MGACEETSREGAGVAARRAGRWQVLGVTPKGVSLGQQRGRLGDTETPREARGTERDSKRRTEGHETETRRVREGKRLTHSDRHPEKLWPGHVAKVVAFSGMFCLFIGTVNTGIATCIIRLF